MTHSIFHKMHLNTIRSNLGLCISVGASDDLVSCAIILEVMRVLTQAAVPLKHAVIINFNGAEESTRQVNKLSAATVSMYNR